MWLMMAISMTHTLLRNVYWTLQGKKGNAGDVGLPGLSGDIVSTFGHVVIMVFESNDVVASCIYMRFLFIISFIML